MGRNSRSQDAVRPRGGYPTLGFVGYAAIPYSHRTQVEIEIGFVGQKFVYSNDGRFLYYIRPDQDPVDTRRSG